MTIVDSQSSPQYFLGVDNERRLKSHPPGAIHHARCMAKAIACKPLVKPSKDCNKLLKQTGPNTLQYSNVDSTLVEVVWSDTPMRTRWQSSHALVTLCGPVPARLCVRSSFLHWFHTHITVIAACPVRAAVTRYDKLTSRKLILLPFASMRHTCTSFHVLTSFGSSTLTEQGITLTLLVRQEMSLLGLFVSHLSGNVINYWWYTGLYISQVWSHLDHSVWVLHFS